MQGEGVQVSGSAQQQRSQSASGQAGSAAQQSEDRKKGKSGGDLLSDALASVKGDKAGGAGSVKAAAPKPQIRVMAKPKAAAAPKVEEGPGGLGLLGSYGSSSGSGSE